MKETNEKMVAKEIIKETEDRQKSSKFKNILVVVKKVKKILMFSLVSILIVIIILSTLFAKTRNITTITESSLKEVIETSELSTIEFIYNSTVTVSDEENNPKYHVAYEGTVKAGFNFNEISIEKDKENKKIIIVIPEIKINSVNINDDTLDFIFVKDKHNTETTFQEAYNQSYADLENKAKSNNTIKKMAYENAVDTMKAIIIPLESKLPNGYVFDFKEECEVK